MKRLLVLFAMLMFGCAAAVSPESSYYGALQKMKAVSNLNISYAVSATSSEGSGEFSSTMSIREYMKGDKLRMDLTASGLGPADSVPIRIYSIGNDSLICSMEGAWKCYSFEEAGLADLPSQLSLAVGGRIAYDEGFASGEFLSFEGVAKKSVNGRNCDEVTMTLASTNSSWAGAGGMALRNATIVACFDDKYGVVLRKEVSAEVSGGRIVVTSTFGDMDAETEIPDEYFNLPA
ncbi:MAG: hypothetical protein NT157_04240 [Candidatus Micrarchaeota archaeon]|nr:hypothetical protein [Candidatus Micrarchaeota archaeon]